MAIQSVSEFISNNITLFEAIIVVIALLVIFNFVIGFFKRKLLKRAKKKKQISNIKIFTRILQITFTMLVVLIAFFSYIGSWTGLGVVAGLLTAALGFALQRPITGIAAWIMVILKRPFDVGDRIAIGDVRGEVYDITLTHVYIDEIGGEIKSDQFSGRNVMIPNHLLFEHNIINYTLTNDYVLGEVLVDVTYESDLNKAIEIAKGSVLEFTKEYANDTTRKPSIRVKMAPSAMTLMIRFFAPIKVMQQVTSDITQDVFFKFQKEKDVEIAYPHSEIIFKDKRIFRK